MCVMHHPKKLQHYSLVEDVVQAIVVVDLKTQTVEDVAVVQPEAVVAPTEVAAVQVIADAKPRVQVVDAVADPVDVEVAKRL